MLRSSGSAISVRTPFLVRFAGLVAAAAGLTACAGASHEPHYPPKSTLACLSRLGYVIDGIKAERWLRPTPIATAAVVKAAGGPVGARLYFYSTAESAQAAAHGWDEQSRRALCATFGQRRDWCLKHVFRKERIPHATDGNVFINFSVLSTTTQVQQTRLEGDLRHCVPSDVALRSERHDVSPIPPTTS